MSADWQARRLPVTLTSRRRGLAEWNGFDSYLAVPLEVSKCVTVAEWPRQVCSISDGRTPVSFRGRAHRIPAPAHCNTAGMDENQEAGGPCAQCTVAKPEDLRP